jgi:BirA family biotin operon repressor/biotin-[acetyl-CoA-carboxylase] ligase
MFAVERPERLARLPLLLPVTLCEELRALGVSGCRLRWPNDLVVDGRKLGGVLIEAVSAGRLGRAAILGFGVNHGNPPESAVERPAIGASEWLGSETTVGALARRLALAVLEAVAAGESDGLIERYRDLSIHRAGDHMRCELARGIVEGEFAGFDARGFLRLQRGDDLRTVASGELIEG